MCENIFQLGYPLYRHGILNSIVLHSKGCLFPIANQSYTEGQINSVHMDTFSLHIQKAQKFDIRAVCLIVVFCRI